jgi:Fe2+ or Zn2+ uptake regulation protein
MSNDPLTLQVTETVHAQGGRMTSQRRLILDLLQSDPSHPTADELFVLAKRIDPSLNLSTVYRTLNWLEERGFVNPRRFDDNHTHKHFDPVLPETGDSHHFHCRRCDRVIEFAAPQVEPLLEQIREEIARQYGLQVDDSALVLSGLCNKCASEIDSSFTAPSDGLPIHKE